MILEQIEQQSRDAVIAYLQDSSVKLEFTYKNQLDWIAYSGKQVKFNLHDAYYRIARNKPWYRVALTRDGVALVTESDLSDKDVEATKNFIKWLTDRIPYDN